MSVYFTKIHYLTSSLLFIKNWENANFPTADSFMSHYIFILIAHHSSIDSHLSLKQLYLSVNFSITGIRKQLFRLIEDEWCFLKIGEIDKRVKYIVANEKMLNVFTKDNLKIQLNAISLPILKDKSDTFNRRDLT